MESEILKFICGNQGAVDTDFLVCNLGCSASEILSSSDKFVPCCPFGQPKVVARTKLRLCRTKDCPGSCRGLHLCKSFLISGSCAFNLTRRGCLFSHKLDSDYNNQILKEHKLEDLSRTELCTLLLQSDDRLLPPICHDYNIGDGLFGSCKEGCACKRLHICEKYLNRDCRCSRNHNFRTPHTLSLLQGMPHDFALKSVFANIQALKYHDIQSNKAKRGNQNQRGNRGNRGRGGRRRGPATKPTVYANSEAGVNESLGCDGQEEDNPDQEQQQPAVGAIAGTAIRGKANSCDDPPPPVLPTPPLLHQTNSADNSGTHQPLQRATATASNGVISATANAGPQPIHPQKTSATTEGESDSAGAHRVLQRATAFAATTSPSVISATASAGPQPQKTSATTEGESDSAHRVLQRATAFIATTTTSTTTTTGVVPAPVAASQQIHLRKSPAATEVKSCDAGTHHPLRSSTVTTTFIGVAATNAGSQQIWPRSTSAATAVKRENTNQPLQHATTTTTTNTAVVSDNGKKKDDSNSQETQQLLIDKNEICMYFIKGYCPHGGRCLKAHHSMPYRWEVMKNGQWTPLPNNEAVEKDFCDPKNTDSSSIPRVNFDIMTCGFGRARRICIGNSLEQPDCNLATEWLWYWEDEFGKWHTYASPDGGNQPANVDSSILEQKFLDDAEDVVTFKAHSQTYSLSFKDMIQKNIHYGTKKNVRRRPRFVSAADVKDGRVSKPGGQNFAAIPNHWDKTQLPQTGFKKVPLVASSDEYKEVASLFRKTMRNFDIVKIERIQNKDLWEVFQLNKTQMKNRNRGQSVLEMKLFHGTDNQYVDAICHSNFDWRICGSHGTAYGKGSYFAKDAKYSHNYTSDTDVKSMFVVRVLVGEYARGSPEYRRAPSKDGGDINFYDSCVDDVHNPTIYVVFDKPQIYPEYVLQYREYDAFGTTFANSSGISRSSYLSQPSQTTTHSYKPITSSFANTTVTPPQKNQPKEANCVIS